MLYESLRPATTLSQLSPADRVFGWVNQRGKGAYKGNVRIGPVTCLTPKEQAIENFGTPGLPLAILGQPKPQQARFYVAASPNGEAQDDHLTKEQAGYSPGKGLRGRKVYPHHRVLQEQEYRRPKLNGQEQRDNQNRSIQGWVKPGTEFTFDIHVTNLSKVELGALLWLLSLPDNHFHRFGGGKPLGFGSVRLEIDSFTFTVAFREPAPEAANVPRSCQAQAANVPRSCQARIERRAEALAAWLLAQWLRSREEVQRVERN